MPITTSDLIDKLDAAITSRSSPTNAVRDARMRFLQHVRDLVQRHGLPLPDDRKLEACAMPYIFQELNYDGYDWSRRTEDFGQLSDILDIDVVIWSGGTTRFELTDEQFEDYNQFCHEAITFRSRRRMF